MWDPYTTTTTTTSPSTTTSPNSLQPHLTPEEKRLRNNSASARFRVKKKIQEQQLVQDTKAAAEKLSMLEGRAQELERENRWLKGLVEEKGRREEEREREREREREAAAAATSDKAAK